eukprot:6231660-Lingulodinium_polyedra.AAC.1
MSVGQSLGKVRAMFGQCPGSARAAFGQCSVCATLGQCFLAKNSAPIVFRAINHRRKKGSPMKKPGARL